MKKHLFTALLALAMTTVAVHAHAVETNDHLRLYEFNFDCHFNDTQWNDNHDDGCTAQAQVFAWVDPDDWMRTLQTARGVSNKFAVKCRDRLVYADSAILDPGHERFVTITGINGVPVLKVFRDDNDHDVLRDGDNKSFGAVLRVDDERLRGSCEVRNRPVYDGAPVLN